MIGYYNYTVILTYVSLASALCGIFAAVGGNPALAVFLLMFSGLCDMFDGKVARTRKRTEDEKNFGIQIDSLCDVVCFGVLPAVIAYTLHCDKWYYVVVLVLFVLCGLIRLGYYNVTEIAREQVTQAKRTEYRGLPITFSAFLFPIAFILRAVIPDAWEPPFFAVVLALIGAAYITPFTIRKPGKVKITLLIVLGAVFLWLIVWLASEGKL